MVCSYIQMEHNPTHTWHAEPDPFQETLGTGNPGMFSMTRRVYRFVAKGKKVFIAS